MVKVEYKDFVLEYNRDAIKAVEAKGVSFQNIGDKMFTNFELLFWGAFQKNHRGTHINKTNEIFEEMKDDGYDMQEMFDILIEMIEGASPLAQTGKETKKFTVVRSK